MSEPVLPAPGRDAVVVVDGHRVVRRYRDAGRASAEAAVLARLGDYGFPVPEVIGRTGCDLVLERPDGPTLRCALSAGDLPPDVAAHLLTDLLARLHALPAPPGAAPGEVTVHLDLHPGTVVLAAGGPVVVGWRCAATGPADLDVAVSALILAEAAVGGVDPTAVAVLKSFLLASGDVAPGARDAAMTLRRSDPELTVVEVGRLASAYALLARSGRTAGDRS